MEHYDAADLPHGWVSVTDLLCIGRCPRAVIHCGTDFARAARVINDGICVSVNDSATAVEVLVGLLVPREQAQQQVAWAAGHDVQGWL
jgi:hypothetical protein